MDYDLPASYGIFLGVGYRGLATWTGTLWGLIARPQHAPLDDPL